MKWTWRAACAALALSASAQAADEAIVVVGTRIPTALERFGGATTVITAADIRLHQYRDITDALASVPGLHLATAGGRGAQSSVFIRGAESNHVLVLIDGVEVTPPGGGVFGFEHLQLNGIERIEVLRGPYSALYGSEGIGGVINIITKRGEGAPTASARLEIGSFATDAVAMNLSGRHGRVDFSLDGGWLQTDGESFTPRRLRGGRNNEDDGYDNFDVKGTVGVEVGAASRVDLSFGYVNADVDYDGFTEPFEVSTLRNSVYEKRYSARWSGEYLQGVWRPVLQGSYYGREFNDVSFDSRGERTQFAWRNDLFFSDVMKFVVGAETELEEVRGSKNARTNAVYLQAWFEPLDTLLLSGGWRNDDPDDFDSDRNWQLAASHMFTGTQLRASYGTAFKAPTLSERFGFGGNPDLDPETSRSWEVGVERTFSVGSAEGGWGIAYFDNRIRNLITFSGSDFRNTNINSAHIEGVESFVSLDTAAGLSLRLDHTITRAYGRGALPLTCQENLRHFRLIRRPLRKATLEARWSDPIWSFAAKLDYIGPRHDCKRDDFSNPDALVVQGGYTLAHISARRRFGDQLALFARVNNLLDRRYEPIDGFAGRGIEFHAGVEVGL